MAGDDFIDASGMSGLFADDREKEGNPMSSRPCLLRAGRRNCVLSDDDAFSTCVNSALCIRLGLIETLNELLHGPDYLAYKFNFDSETTELASGVLLIILLGAAELVIGLAILKLKEHFGSFANALGIIKIVYGIMLITVILAVFAIFIAVPLLIVETIFLYQISKKISQ